MNHWLKPVDVFDRAPLWQLAHKGVLGAGRDPTLEKRISNEAYAALRKATDPKAHLVKAVLYLKGWGGAPHDIRRGIRHLWCASLNNVAQASYDLACLYLMGVKVKTNPTVGFRLMCLAARGGLVDGIEHLGRLFYEGIGTSADPFFAKDLLREAALAGSLQARHNLAVIYRNEKRYRFAVSQLLVAADAGYPPSQFALGLHLLLGEGIRSNSALGRLYIRLAAAKGDRDAIAFLTEKKE